MNEKFLAKFLTATLKIRHHTNKTLVRKISKRRPLERGRLPSARVLQCHLAEKTTMFVASKVASPCLSRILSRDYHKLWRPLKQCCQITRAPSFRDGLDRFNAGIERYTVGFLIGRHAICTSSADHLSWKDRW